MRSQYYRISLKPFLILINPRHVFESQLVICVVICIIFILLLSKTLYSTPSKREIVFIKQLSSSCQLTPAEEWDVLLNEYSLSTNQIFFRHATAQRNSSYPFISGDTFRALADHIFDETTNISRWADRMWEIGRGDIVFLGTENEMLKHFFTKTTFNRIIHPFVLVTHNSDMSVPTKEFKWVLDDKRILAWFAQNPDYEHNKLFPIPIGVANTRWIHGNVTAIKQAVYIHRKPFAQRTTLLYVNFEVETNKKVRSKALNWAIGLTKVTQRKSVSFETYLKDIGNAKFVLSPPGNGLDCHRTWEAMIMGAIPIVLRSTLDPLFTNESVLIIDDWEQVTLDYLNSLDYPLVPSRKVLAKYWYKRLLQAANRA